ncbi:MAG: methionyl-tRNA formyltransferase [Dehalococcoidia bacterium]|nr:methionyl-tRNA formyltransferase [Dehalococcoidia bacterium]
MTSYTSSENVRVVFMGTPAFAIPSLEGMLSAGYQVVGVFTAPDRPAGRGREPAASPIKEFALTRGLSVYQPASLRRNHAQEIIAWLRPEMIVLAAYGILLPKAVLDIPARGSLNVHPSLLPRYRGASPVTWPILCGDAETGVSIFLMDAGMDTGPILSQRSVLLKGDETTGSLTGLLAGVGADLLLATIPKWLAGEITPVPQDDSKASLTRLLKKDDGYIDWRFTAMEIERRVRGYNPWPGAYTIWQGKALKILASSAHSHDAEEELAKVVQIKGQNNETVMGVQTGDGVLVVEQIQLEGRRAMNASEFVKGQRGFVGSVLGG